VSVKKTKDLRFTFQDVNGTLRVVTLHVRHVQEGGRDRVSVVAASDGVTIETSACVAPTAARVKSKSRF
jgi:hypothetical protein